MTEPVLTRTPVRLRRVCVASAVVLVVAFGLLALLLPTGRPPGTGPDQLAFGRADQVALFGLGLLLGAGVLAVARPRLDADAGEVHVRNILGSHDVPWSLVVAVRFDEGSPWAALELPDDELLPLMAVQAADGDAAFDAVDRLRALHLAARRAAS